MNLLPGDYGVVDLQPSGVNLFVAGMIRLVTRSPWCHAFVVVEDGKIVEARPTGACLTSLSNYDSTKIKAFNDLEPKTPEQRTAIAKEARRLVGTPYGFLDIAALLLASVGLGRLVKHRVERDDRLICSQLVDLAYQRAGVKLFDDGRLPQDVTPGDLGLRIDTRPWEAPTNG